MTEEMRQKIVEAVEKLDHANDEHWTGAGKVNMNILQGLVGPPKTRDDIVTRKMLDEAVPGIVRRAGGEIEKPAEAPAPAAPPAPAQDDGSDGYDMIGDDQGEEPDLDADREATPGEEPAPAPEVPPEPAAASASAPPSVPASVPDAEPSVIGDVDLAAEGKRLRAEMASATSEVVVRADKLESLYETLDSAAARVRQLERENETLRDQLGRATAALTRAQGELAKFGRTPLDRAMAGNRGYGTQRPNVPLLKQGG